jgi:CoA:oxalate CoA-transferase
MVAAGVPCAPVNTIDRVFADAQVLHRKMLLEIEHPAAGTARMAGIPVKLSETPASVRLPPPLLGQHRDEILESWLRLPRGEIEELIRKNVI